MSQARHHSANTTVDALLQASRGGELRQTFALAELPRIAEQASDDAKVELRARFKRIDDRVMIDGRVAATLRLRCQRCLQSVFVPVDDEFNVVVVDSDAELGKLSEAQDAIVADPTRLDLAWLTEEQLLLAAPLAPVHVDAAECAQADAVASLAASKDRKADASATKQAVQAPTTQRPFAALRRLMMSVDDE